MLEIKIIWPKRYANIIIKITLAFFNLGFFKDTFRCVIEQNKAQSQAIRNKKKQVCFKGFTCKNRNNTNKTQGDKLDRQE